MKRALALVLAGGLLGCQPATTGPVHYVLGKPYQVGKVWFYPSESYALRETGLASVIPSGHAATATDGEAFSQSALAAAHPTLQLPAIARVTNLETGKGIVVRINDRGTGNPARLVEVTQRVAELLGIRGTARVRLEVLPEESHAVADQLADAPRLAMNAAPRGTVEVAELPPPPGVRSSASRPVTRPVGAADDAPRTVPAVLPETVTQGPPSSGRLWVRLDTFEEYQYANVQRARVAGLRPRIVSVFEDKTHRFRVEIGPIDDVRQAETTLDQALSAGIPDARIVVE
jgi:rare lipoprotein A